MRPQRATDPRGNPDTELYKGEQQDNVQIKKAVEGELEDEEDSDSDEEKEDAFLEELGFAGPLTPTQEKYKERLKAKLEAEKEAERAAREERSQEFNAGKAAYTKGRYKESVVLFERALNREGWMSALGGDIQMWLALAYQAVGRDRECIDLYKKVEDTHPLRKVRQQAANLRFILEAPKLKRGPDEIVSIPVLKPDERVKVARGKYKRPVPTAQLPSKRKKSLEEEFWENYRPPKWTQNRYVWVAATILGVALAIYSAQGRK